MWLALWAPECCSRSVSVHGVIHLRFPISKKKKRPLLYYMANNRHRAREKTKTNGAPDKAVRLSCLAVVARPLFAFDRLPHPPSPRKTKRQPGVAKQTKKINTLGFEPLSGCCAVLLLRGARCVVLFGSLSGTGLGCSASASTLALKPGQLPLWLLSVALCSCAVAATRHTLVHPFVLASVLVGSSGTASDQELCRPTRPASWVPTEQTKKSARSSARSLLRPSPTLCRLPVCPALRSQSNCCAEHRCVSSVFGCHCASEPPFLPTTTCIALSSSS